MEEIIRQRMEEETRIKELQQKRLQENASLQSKKEELQQRALALLDKTNNLRTNKEHDNAIAKYRQVLKLFAKLGWNQQRINIEREIIDTQNEAEDWQQELKAQQRVKEAVMRKKLAKEAEIRKKDAELQQINFDLKSMIKNAAIEQERKQIRETMRKKGISAKVLPKNVPVNEKTQGMRLLKEELRRKLC